MLFLLETLLCSIIFNYAVMLLTETSFSASNRRIKQFMIRVQVQKKKTSGVSNVPAECQQKRKYKTLQHS